MSAEMEDIGYMENNSPKYAFHDRDINEPERALRRELSQARVQIRELQEQRYDTGKTLKSLLDVQRQRQHIDLPAEQTLPVPRFEICLEASPEGEWDRVVKYRLVYRHFLGHCIAVPFGETKICGGFKVANGIHYDVDGQPDLPLRDGAHIYSDALQFGLPAFVICGDEIKELDVAGHEAFVAARNQKL